MMAISGLWKWQDFILAQGQVNGHNVLVQRNFTHTKEQIMHKELNLALALLIPHINSLKTACNSIEM